MRKEPSRILKKRIINKCIGNIKDRILGVQNDLKAFIYIRKNNLQHKEDNIGGGNIVVALSLFSCLNLLGKTYYCGFKPEKFNSNDGTTANETAVFVSYIKFLLKNKVDIGLPKDGSVLEIVWNGFRNYLAHRLTVEPGKSVLTFYFEQNMQGTISDVLLNAKKHSVFKHDGNNRNWILNGDSLLAYLPEIVDTTTNYIFTNDSIDENLLLKVVGVEYP